MCCPHVYFETKHLVHALCDHNMAACKGAQGAAITPDIWHAGQSTSQGSRIYHDGFMQAQVQAVSLLEKQMRVMAGDNQVLKHKIDSEVTLKISREKTSKRKEAEYAAALAALKTELAAKDTQVQSSQDHCRLCCH